MKRKMKKPACLIVVVLLCGVLPMHAQTSNSRTKPFSIGLIGGLNFAEMRFPNNQGPEDQDVTTLLRFGAGAVLDLRLSQNLFARIEPMYLQKGCKIEEGSDPVNQPGGTPGPHPSKFPY